MTTHTVLNQVPALEGYNFFDTDLALREGVQREGASWAIERLSAFGARAGHEETFRWGVQANENRPVLKTHDRFGHRLDEVDFHPAWHALMNLSVGQGLHSSVWTDTRAGRFVARTAEYLMLAQAEEGHLCPVTMTFGVLAALRKQPSLCVDWEPKILSTTYDFGLRPLADKRGVILGMAMTEKQGGSDVRSNSTRAVADGAAGPGALYRLTGHKWFCSAPMSDAFLVLAQAPGGLSCFLLPRVLPDSSRNVFRIQRLKDKLGNRSNASSEVEFENSAAWLVGEEGRGVANIIEMGTYTRFDCALGAAAVVRQGLVQALHHARYRYAFGRRLAEQPLMQSVLADVALESEASTLLLLRLARAYERQATDTRELAYKRIVTAVAKYFICKRAPTLVAETMEALGGNGYAEESILPRLYREAPLPSIWEGSGNVICLDVLRTMQKDQAAIPSVLAELEGSRGADRRYDAFVDGLKVELASPTHEDEAHARGLVERLALALQGALVVKHSPKAVADAYCATRLAGEHGLTLGTLPRRVDAQAIMARAWP
ncbi:MAG: isovaleryl-CoA dehydrogenase [Myxococcaceae bacterium]|nr:isovaleryl-CoA dehydrogenase [Myxococcaceae bacterium]